MAPCFIFLGAKVEEQPRKLEHVLKVAYRCLHKDSDAQLDVQSDVSIFYNFQNVNSSSLLGGGGYKTCGWTGVCLPVFRKVLSCN